MQCYTSEHSSGHTKGPCMPKHDGLRRPHKGGKVRHYCFEEAAKTKGKKCPKCREERLERSMP